MRRASAAAAAAASGGGSGASSVGVAETDGESSICISLMSEAPLRERCELNDIPRRAAADADVADADWC